MRHLPRTIITAAGIVLLVTLCGCCSSCRVPDAPVPTVVVHATVDGDHAAPTPFAVFSASGQILWARGPCDYRDPVTGRFARLPAGAEVAFTDGPIEFDAEPQTFE